ncbi:unnamed protein product [Effrenium voratum]|uniref:DRBM domain-containing protein n=1 Tax=Effrenium voratum TaxID=2562239 RepID=A0AA36IZW0_9DINO|nr:unnamed protein product [Effrenium voratum]
MSVTRSSNKCQVEFLEPELPDPRLFAAAPAPAPSAASAPLAREPSPEAVGLLQCAVAKQLGRSVKKGDVEYSFEVAAGQFVATVVLPEELQMGPFKGDPEVKKAGAKKSAAEAALADPGWGNLTKGWIRGAPDAPVVAISEARRKCNKAQGDAFQKPAQRKAREAARNVKMEPTENPVGKLNERLSAIARRTLTQQDVSYNFTAGQYGFACTVSVDQAALGIDPGHLIQAAGDVAASKKEAKSQAAAALLACPNLEEYLPLPERPKTEKSERPSVVLLQQVLQKLLRRVPTEDDLIYTFQEDACGSFVASLQIPIMPKLATVLGAPAPSRHEAKQLAAWAALQRILES